MAMYFDNAATTSPSAAAINAYINALQLYGNPSSSHKAGMAAHNALEKARQTLSALIGCKADELYFTASGTEANNTAVFGLYALQARRSKRVVLTDSEHPSVTQCAKRLEAMGAELVYIPTAGGRLDTAQLEQALKQPTALVCVMAVNNETGAVYDLKAVRGIINRSGCGAYLHCDAVQGFMKRADIKLLLKCADTASFSSHKLHAPRGVGALTVRSGIRLAPYIYGGGQEKGLRSGTENVAGAVAFAAAAAEYTAEKLAHVKEVREALVNALAEGGNVGFNVPAEHVDGILSISLYGIKSETALNCLSSQDIYISASSACSSKKGHSTVMQAFGLGKAELDSALRIGISPYNTVEEARALADALLAARERYGRI